MNKSKQQLTNGILTYKYGFEEVLKILDENFKDYENEFLKLKSITSVIKGIIRFDFLVINDKAKEQLKDIEVTLNKHVQNDIFKVYADDFSGKLLRFLNKKVEEVKLEMEEANSNKEYEVQTSIVTTFQYLKNSSILRLEILL